jgi:hypothetical protein
LPHSLGACRRENCGYGHPAFKELYKQEQLGTPKKGGEERVDAARETKKKRKLEVTTHSPDPLSTPEKAKGTDTPQTKAVPDDGKMFLGPNSQTRSITLCPATALRLTLQAFEDFPVHPWALEVHLSIESRRDSTFGVPIEKLEVIPQAEEEGATQQSTFQAWFIGVTSCGEVTVPIAKAELTTLCELARKGLYLVEFPLDMSLDWLLVNMAETANLHPKEGYGDPLPLFKIDREYVMEAPCWSLDTKLLASLATTALHQTYVVQLLSDNPVAPVVLHEACRMVPLFKDNELSHPLVIAKAMVLAYQQCFSCARGSCDLPYAHGPSRFPHLDNKLRTIVSHAGRLNVPL